MTTLQRPIEEGWNLFAVELVHALAPTKTLRSLESVINPGVVQRLVQSLEYQGTFPVLGANDLQEVIRAFRLEDTIRHHLIAAIMATSIQQKLTQRLDSANKGRAAAYALIDIIEDAVVEAENDPASPLGGLKSSSLNTPSVDPIQNALAAIDRGMMSLYTLDYMAENAPDRIHVAREANGEFTLALAHLESADKDHPHWTYWHTEALQGQRNAIDYGGE